MNKAEKTKQGMDNRLWGEQAEAIAAEFFLKEGYTIRERNWRLDRYEVDLILEKERTIIFVEVKARQPGRQDPVEAVDRNKRRRIMIAADVYLRRMPVLYQYRFDIFTVIGTPDNYKTFHYPDAFLPGVNGR